MPQPAPAILLSCLLLAPCGVALAQASAPTDCHVDRARLLALDEQRFDQDMAGGWRELASRPGCNLAAADLVRDYRQAQRNEAGLLVWHEAQLRAFGGQALAAATLMERARKPADADRAGWNPYVDATVAFLRRDRAAFDKARAVLAAVPVPVGKDIPPVVNGFMEIDGPDGQKRQMRWPPNIDVVDGLRHCFDKSYEEAYGSDACRAGGA